MLDYSPIQYILAFSNCAIKKKLLENKGTAC